MCNMKFLASWWRQLIWHLRIWFCKGVGRLRNPWLKRKGSREPFQLHFHCFPNKVWPWQTWLIFGFPLHYRALKFSLQSWVVVLFGHKYILDFPFIWSPIWFLIMKLCQYRNRNPVYSQYPKRLECCPLVGQSSNNTRQFTLLMKSVEC